MKCLESTKVRHELGNDDDPLAGTYAALQAKNDITVHQLNLEGLNGNLLAAKVDVKIHRSSMPVTAGNTLQRQEQLMGAHSAGDRFYTLNGHHSSHNDMFIAKEMSTQKATLEELGKQKKRRVELKRRDDEAGQLLSRKFEIFLKPELELLLLWQGIKRKDHPPSNPKKLEKWLELEDKAPPTFEEWTAEDEAKLERIRTMKIDINDTAIGRAKKVVTQEYRVLFRDMSKGKQLEAIEGLEKDRDTGITGPVVQL